ncbi:protein kinase [Hamiltosporidium magnivora]|uniref:Protein kinase n=2 Tax=Hamiltosporidium TaxID=1176354 RepID=A0A4Q9LEV7_9MICR|nr:protein kinase [Hamiltosporidium magnivora]
MHPRMRRRLLSKLGILLVLLSNKIYCGLTPNLVNDEQSTNKYNESLESEQIDQITEILKLDRYSDIKFITRGIYEDELSESEIMKEISFLKQLSHPNIISGTLFSNGYINYLEMRFVEFDLTEYVKKFPLTIYDIKEILKQVLDALYYLKNKQIIHNDLKHNNILIDEYLNIKICDFGFSCYKKELVFQFKTLSPTVLEKYIVYSPELNKSEEYYEKSDMYSFESYFFHCTHLDPKHRPSVDSLLMSAYFDFLYENMFCFGELKDFEIKTETKFISKKDKILTIIGENENKIDIFCCCHILTSLRYTSKSKKLNLGENDYSNSTHTFNQITTKRFLYSVDKYALEPIQFMTRADRLEYLVFFSSYKKYQEKYQFEKKK